MKDDKFNHGKLCIFLWLVTAPLIAQLVKNLRAMQVIQFLGWEDPLEKGKATDSTTLAWVILFMGSDTTERLSLSLGW